MKKQKNSYRNLDVRQPPGILYFDVIYAAPLPRRLKTMRKGLEVWFLEMRIMETIVGSGLHTPSEIYCDSHIFLFILFSLHYARRLIIATQRLELKAVVEREIFFYFFYQFYRVSRAGIECANAAGWKNI